MSLSEYFQTTIYRYHVADSAFIDANPSGGLSNRWPTAKLKPEFRQWCRDNLTPGYDIVEGRGKAIVTLTDETDADMLVLAWGPSHEDR